ncbi:hypothetical protein LTR78_005550 [Recurvomyces mirabilis]|uniref:Uncharacterized protein n=1 Tax=Recurvomyces mirabilis TaxID=574656 RepID=A0AAE0WMI8_9PEZI|nr:hypothetical protein LTR78_005550 [Recurvomyces mirabilis]KAK5158459.1 hypothetical protein LTS14_003478 [Recurvomyces mirabilis]
MRLDYAPVLAFIAIASWRAAVSAAFVDQNATRHALLKRDSPFVAAENSWTENKMFRQHFEMKGLGCGSVTFAFDGWPGTPSDKKMNIQCWAGGKWDWQFDVTYDNQGHDSQLV